MNIGNGPVKYKIHSTSSPRIKFPIHTYTCIYVYIYMDIDKKEIKCKQSVDNKPEAED